ncbi:putative Patatin-like serine hydrolase [Cladophialophora carrionii]|uniref:Putative Patatin-like serine hydrolase n=1 Tax=Cladophialophora carrionii TaxID=86049 RepID=A0A1C1CW08_9EURO|nr:putative Patatin-like serine hydrolase [Cladophialophora carrionii]
MYMASGKGDVGGASISQLGTYQDGGVNHHNNPINIALWESRYIWPSVVRPDVVLSLGTGYEETGQSPVVMTPKVKFPWSFSFSVRETPLHRLIQSFKGSMDGQSTWRELMNHIHEDEKRDYFRLTLELPGPEPAIDDYGAMELLSSAVRLQPRGPEARRNVLMALLISSFYFELHEIPTYNNGMYYCNGAIRCRSSGALRSLLNVHPLGDLEFFNGRTSLGAFLSDRDLCKSCRRYQKTVHFFVKSLEDEISLCLKWSVDQTRNISAMPRRVSWFIDRQGLDMPFGAAAICDPPSVTCKVCTLSEQVPALEREPLRRPKRKLEAQSIEDERREPKPPVWTIEPLRPKRKLSPVREEDERPRKKLERIYGQV